MKRLFTFITVLFIISQAQSQIIATVELKEPVDGMCGETLYALHSGFDAQQQPKCDLSDEELVRLMNEKIDYLKTHPKAKGKGIMGIYINCEGMVIASHSGLKDGESQLSKEIENFLLENGRWTSGVYRGENVDCSELIAIKIKKGIIYLD